MARPLADFLRRLTVACFCVLLAVCLTTASRPSTDKRALFLKSF